MAYMPPEMSPSMLLPGKYGDGGEVIVYVATVDGTNVDMWSCGRILLEMFVQKKASTKFWATAEAADPAYTLFLAQIDSKSKMLQNLQRPKYLALPADVADVAADLLVEEPHRRSSAADIYRRLSVRDETLTRDPRLKGDVETVWLAAPAARLTGAETGNPGRNPGLLNDPAYKATPTSPLAAAQA